MAKTHLIEIEEPKPVSVDDKKTLMNRAECVGRVHEYINTVVPVLIAQLETGFKLKNCGTLYQKG